MPLPLLGQAAMNESANDTFVKADVALNAAYAQGTTHLPADLSTARRGRPVLPT